MSEQPGSEHVFCGNCGAQNPRGQKFCSNCGAQLAAPPEGTEQQRPAPPPPPLASTTAAPPRKQRRLLRGCLIALGVLLLLAVIGALIGDEDTATDTTGQAEQQAAAIETPAPEPAAEPAEEPAAEPTAEPIEEPTEAPTPETLPAVGEDVRVGDVRWQVLEVEDVGQTLTADNEFIDPKTTRGKFVQVVFEMENLSNEMLTFAGLDLVDDRGRNFTSMSDAFVYIPEDRQCVIINNINPNVPLTCEAIYELPADATGLKLKVGDLEIFGADEALIDLGL